MSKKVLKILARFFIFLLGVLLPFAIIGYFVIKANTSDFFQVLVGGIYGATWVNFLLHKMYFWRWEDNLYRKYKP